ncbi:DUF262 domain-containing protein [Streptosporangium sp. NBC_01495]|uniref:DUF262 domain-containing protein n=1 Tax=Streptosporangium sp. NBC_01495 TaxID=2903899 RepID=UPI002E310D13|nr:DUF262 domain-containing protein [Streptosporangium sp. NBC_01495]
MASPRSLRGPARPRTPTLREVLSELAEGALRIAPGRTGAPPWPEHRQRMLVDSVLRGWPIGPLYVVAAGPAPEVVDGAQRLTALLAFVKGAFGVDGLLSPVDPMLRELNGMRYTELGSGLRQAIDDYPLVIIELDGVRPEHVRPMLFRLNGQEWLTPEQRLSIETGGFGEQVRTLVVEAADRGFEPGRIGFSNIGLAYEDVVTRLLVAAEAREVGAAGELEARAKSAEPVADDVSQWTADALSALLRLPSVDGAGIRFSKATLLSWLLLLVQAGQRFGPASAHHVGRLLEWFERQRRRVAAGLELTNPPPVLSNYHDLPYAELLALFNEYAAIDALNTAQILRRDVILWLFLLVCGGLPSPLNEPGPLLSRLYRMLADGAEPDTAIAEAASERWGVW